MSSTQTLNEILDNLKFTEKEKEGFNQAIQVVKDYLRTGSVDMEKKFKEIVDRVIEDEIQEN